MFIKSISFIKNDKIRLSSMFNLLPIMRRNDVDQERIKGKEKASSIHTLFQFQVIRLELFLRPQIPREIRQQPIT